MVSVGLGADLRYLESGSAPDVRGMLDSKFPQEKLHGMKSIFGMAMLNQPVINFFGDVVKNVGVENMEVKKLDLRDKAASEAVATESRRREAAQLPRGWTLDKDVHGRTVYISPPGHKGHAKGRQFYSRPEGFGEAGSSVCVLL